jgi:predicted esterase
MKTLLGVITGAVLLAGSLTVAHAAEKHLFYVHGCCVKDMNDPKVKAYEKIVQELKSSGFNVVFELRTADIGDSDAGAQAYAKKIAEQVQALLAKGTPPESITVAGYSLGSMTTLVASGLVNNPKVNFVLLAGCPINPAIKVNIDYSKVKGRVLSITDTKDEKFGSCNGKLPEGTAYKEIVLNSGEGHAVFRLTDEKNLKLWKDPLVEWSTNK